jgi:hypothetical protein
MIYQLRWKTEPGLRGLSCSEFGASPTTVPDTERGVAVDFASDTERDAFMWQLEEVFGPQRFSNNAAAFETVKAYVLEWAAKRSGE